MNDEKFNNFNHSFNELKKQLKELKRKRKQLNNTIKKYINNFQIIESEVYKSLFNAREFYNKRRKLYNKKIRKLKKRKDEYEQILNDFIEEKKTLQKPEHINNISKQIGDIKKSIKQIEYKIDKLNKILTTQILDINEENDIVEEISKLERKKEKRIELLSKAEQEQNMEMHNSIYYKILENIEMFENDLEGINKNLTKWFNKRRTNHKKMLNLYRKAKNFKNYKEKMENELKENKIMSEDYYSNFLEILGQNEEILREIKHYRLKDKPRPRQIITPELNFVIERKKLYKKFMKEKKAIALEKKKAGKRMHISEFKLILDDSKK